MDVAWYLPVLIFAARIGDVSLGTVRMIFVINGWRIRAAAIGFLEVIIWALAVGGLVANLTEPVILLSYAAGYAAGTLVGMTIEQHLGFGIRMVQVVNRDREKHVAQMLRDHGYRCTRVEGSGRDGPIELCFTVVKRKKLQTLLKLLGEIAPEAIVTVERADSVTEAALTAEIRLPRRSWGLFQGHRK
jgi:uncharacterized protein YebE (UPF0316 family)